MQPFITEEQVRLRFQAADASLVSSELVQLAIADAFALAEDRLPETRLASPSPRLTQGLVQLAGAHLLRALAAGDAAAAQELTIAGQRLDTGKRFASLLRLAEESEKEAWLLLSPYIAQPPAAEILATTDTQPILGEAAGA